MDLDEVLVELSDVAAKLSDLPVDALEERFHLRQRQEELRAISRQLLSEKGDLLSADELQVQLGRLEEERDRYLSETRLSHSAGAQTGQGGGIDPKVVHDMHRSMDKAFDLDGVNAEIDRLRRRLARLEGA
ncbi:MAG: hypothetical protein OES13_02185 [Acidimicrobiia bacterium]|nr:hypothetical protein [Acidimicrobiia bacterium]